MRADASLRALAGFGAVTLLSVALRQPRHWPITRRASMPIRWRLRHGIEGVEGRRRSGRCASQYGLGLLYDLGPWRSRRSGSGGEMVWPGCGPGPSRRPKQSGAALCRRPRRAQGYEPADQLWLSAGKSGDVEAQFNLGLSYYRGEGVPKSYPDAAGWFRKAAEGGSVDGQYAIAEMYRIGRGVPKNISRGAALVYQGRQSGQRCRRRSSGEPAARCRRKRRVAPVLSPRRPARQPSRPRSRRRPPTARERKQRSTADPGQPRRRT